MPGGSHPPTRQTGRQPCGIGAGAYLAFDRKGEEREILAGLVSLTAGYQFLESWVVRVNWHRVMVNYDRDTDVILAGMGYLF